MLKKNGTHRENFGNGQWNYLPNKAGFKKFWEDGLGRNKNCEQVITMAMRGDGDLPMKDLGSADANFKLMERIMNDQREIIEKVTKKTALNTPQLWALYTEVSEYYNQDMKVPDDIIILLCDDNWGDVRRFPELGSKKLPGGYGIYYHVDLHGAPRAYRWLNMTQIPHMWEQLQLTYSYGINKVWILNVGDLKPYEYPMDFFLNMAWVPTSFNKNNLNKYIDRFCEEQFGKEASLEAAKILNTYYKYISCVLTEMLDHRTYNLHSEEFLQVKDAYMSLETRELRQFMEIPDKYKDSYKELILHPVQAIANLYYMYYAIAMNRKLAAEKDLSANYWADQVECCFKRDEEITKDYNLNVSNGKWNHIMDQTHISYKSWDEPREGNIIPKTIHVKPEETRKGGYIFSEKNSVVVVEAVHYFQSKANDKTQWEVIPDLGRTLSCIALMPYAESTNGTAIDYKMKLNSATDSNTLRLFFDSTLPFKKGGQNVAVSFDGGNEVTCNINLDLNWKNCYTKMYPAGDARMIESSIKLQLPKSVDGKYLLTIRTLDPGKVIYKAVLNNGGYEDTYLKMSESPYNR